MTLWTTTTKIEDGEVIDYADRTEKKAVMAYVF